jgi:2-keto-3-deoxy-6-phosphogluconate aldolase
MNLRPQIDALLAIGRVVPVITIDRVEDAVPLARALVAGGVRLLEVTLRTAAGLAAATKIMAEVPGAVVGIGTVLTPADLERAVGIGARFALSPGATPALLAAAAAAPIPFIPGVATASEVMQAIAHGFDTVKFFPATAAGRHFRGERGGMAGATQRGRGRRLLAHPAGRRRGGALERDRGAGKSSRVTPRARLTRRWC